MHVDIPESTSAVDSDIARAVGKVEGEVQHLTRRLEESAQHVSDVKGDIEWLKSQISALEQKMSEAPATSVDELRTAITNLEERFSREHQEPEHHTELPEVDDEEETPEAELEQHEPEHHRTILHKIFG